MGSNKPVWEVRLGGVRAAIWRNENKTTGKPWFNVELTRRFKQGEEWHDSSSFNGLADLALVRLATELATAWLSRQELEQEVE